MRAGIYARHSTDKQGTSSEDQIRRCQEFCRFKGYDVVEVYRDEALSGAHIENRPGINALLIGALDGRFDVVIAEDLSRISRDQADTANFFKKMIFLGVPVETVSEGLINELHIGLKSTMNALYLKDLAEKTHRGVIAAVLRGGVPGGKLYGYDLVQLNHYAVRSAESFLVKRDRGRVNLYAASERSTRNKPQSSAISSLHMLPARNSNIYVKTSIDAVLMHQTAGNGPRQRLSVLLSARPACCVRRYITAP